MINKCKLFLLYIFASLFLFGCVTPNNENDKASQVLVIKYYDYYLVTTNSSHLDIAAMLRTFSGDLYKSPPGNWDEWYLRAGQYTNSAGTVFIDRNYPELATDEEMKFFDSYIRDFIVYEINNDGNPRMSVFDFESISTKIVISITNYEYNNR